jgi:DMSO/TMAO reductase YedYZ heme-binding membrane subunit
MVLSASAVLGVLLASRTAQRLRLLKGRTFRVHRLLSVMGAGLLLAHPVPIVLARNTTGAGPAAVFVPFAAEKLVLNIAFGALALDVLLVVLASSLLIKCLPRKAWRRLHYGAYAALALGLYHGLLIPDDFGPAARYTRVDPLALDKALLESAIGGILLASAWRVAAGVRRRVGPRGGRSRRRPRRGLREGHDARGDHDGGAVADHTGLRSGRRAAGGELVTDDGPTRSPLLSPFRHLSQKPESILFAQEGP